MTSLDVKVIGLYLLEKKNNKKEDKKQDCQNLQRQPSHIFYAYICRRITDINS